MYYDSEYISTVKMLKYGQIKLIKINTIVEECRIFCDCNLYLVRINI